MKILLLVVLLLGIPLFVRMPLWVDATFYDVAARNMLMGGVHYRDIFDTNLPGMIWAQAILRVFFGFSSEVLRIADLLVVGLSLWLIGRILKKAGIGSNQRMGFLIAVSLFYLFETEFIHTQRDVWMLLPVLAAVSVRLQRVSKVPHPAEPNRSPFPSSFLEGTLWGLAVWIKPHVLIVALCVFLSSPRRRDVPGLLAGGILVGMIGVGWLVVRGEWVPLLDVMQNWNPAYLRASTEDFTRKLLTTLTHFGPWSLVNLVALWVAVANFTRPPFPDHDPRLLPTQLLSALYLGWILQALLLQRSFPYILAPGVILALSITARLNLPMLVFGWSLAMGAMWELSVQTGGGQETLVRLRETSPIVAEVLLPERERVNAGRLKYWPDCFREMDSAKRKAELSWYRNNPSCPGWEELARVAEFLKTKNLKDQDLLCWCDSTHPLYLDLNIKPGWRFMHPMTMMAIEPLKEKLLEERRRSPAKYVVADLEIVRYFHPFDLPESGLLPPGFPESEKGAFPWNLPVIYRGGRFTVHEIP